MKHIPTRHYWVGRLMASDPGLKRLIHAGKAVTSLISSFFTMLFILKFAEKTIITPAVVSGMIGMLGILTVMDDTTSKKKVTTLLLAVSAFIGITLGSLLADNPYYIGALMVFIVCCAFYFTRFGSRYFSISMVGFMTVYISSLLKLDSNQLAWFFVGITFGIIYAYFYNFIVFQDSAHILKRSVRSFHIQANLTFNILIKMIRDTANTPKQRRILRNNIIKLGEYARGVSGELNEQDVAKLWPGLNVSQLRLYVFDAAMLVETLADTLRRLKKADAFDTKEIEELIVWVVKALRDTEVLSQSYNTSNLEEAERALQALRNVLIERLNQGHQGESWLYLIRRLESIANHVIEGALSIQTAIHAPKNIRENQDITKEELKMEAAIDIDKQKGLKPSTKKTYQALPAGILSLLIGYIISPTQPYWVILTAFIVLLGTESVGRTYIKGLQRSIGTVIGAVLGFGLAKLFSGHSILEVILIFIAIFFAFYLFAVSYTLMSMFITLLLAFVYDLLLGGISFSLLGARVIDTIAGSAIALGAATFIFPKKTKDSVSDSMGDFLDILSSYVKDYVRSFREDVDVKGLSNRAFDLDQKLQVIRDHSQSLVQRPSVLANRELARSITIFTAINYFAKHLVASAYTKNFDYPEILVDEFKKIEEKLDHNLKVLRNLIKGNFSSTEIYNLNDEREMMERLAPGRSQSQRDLIHHLYYVWRINQSIVLLSTEFGAEEK